MYLCTVPCVPSPRLSMTSKSSKDAATLPTPCACEVSKEGRKEASKQASKEGRKEGRKEARKEGKQGRRKEARKKQGRKEGRECTDISSSLALESSTSSRTVNTAVPSPPWSAVLGWGEASTALGRSTWNMGPVHTCIHAFIPTVRLSICVQHTFLLVPHWATAGGCLLCSVLCCAAIHSTHTGLCG